MSQRSILAVEICLDLEPTAHQGLLQALTLHNRNLSPGEKWKLFHDVVAILVANQSRWVSGCWDFFDDDNRARSGFNMWVQGMMTEEGARPAPSGTPDVYRGERRYMTFTIAALMLRGAPSERTLCQTLEIPEDRLWFRQTFVHVLWSMRHLNFASVEGSTLYLIPKDPSFGLTDDDLRHPKFEYLRRMV